MQEWAGAFDAPVYLHANDREWVMRDSPMLHFWQGDTLDIFPAVTLLRLGGHFAGGTVLHWQEGGGVLLAGDILQVTPGKDAVSFMWSYPNMLPLPARSVEDVTGRLVGKNSLACTALLKGKISWRMRMRLCSGRARNILLV